MSIENKLFKIGIVINTFGIKGTLKILLNEDIQINQGIEKLNVIFIKNKGVYTPFQVIDKKIKERNLLMISLKNIENINEANKLKNFEIFVNCEEDIFSKVISLKEYKVRWNNLEFEIIDELDNGLQTLIKIQNDNQKSFWVPIVDSYVEKVDHNKMLIILKDIEGLK